MTVIYRVHRSLIFSYWLRTLVDCYSPEVLLDIIQKYCCEKMNDDQGTDFRPIKIVDRRHNKQNITYFNVMYGVSYGRLRSEIREHLHIKSIEYIRILQRNKGISERFNFEIVNAKNRKEEMSYHYFNSFGSEIIIDENKYPNRTNDLWIFIAFQNDLNNFKDFWIPYHCKITYEDFLIQVFKLFNKQYNNNIQSKYILKRYKYDNDKKDKWIFADKKHEEIWEDLLYVLQYKRDKNSSYGRYYYYYRETYNKQVLVLCKK